MLKTSSAPTGTLQLPQALRAGQLCMTMMGAAATYFGPTLLYIAAEARQPVATVGVIFGMYGLGFFLSTLFANRLARRFEMRRSVLIGGAILGAGTLLYMLAPFPANIASALLMGFGSGTMEVIFNRLVELLAVDQPAAALTRLHATWGIGAVAMPLAVVAVAQLGLNWRVAGGLLLVWVLFNTSVIFRWPEFAVDHGPDVDWGAVPWRSIGLFGLMVVIYAGVENSAGGWATTFFARLGLGQFTGALATSFFYLMLSIGRLVFASGVERMNYARVVQLANGLAAAALMLTFFPALALVGFGLAGLGFSVVFSTLLAWATRRHPALRAQMTSLSIAAAGLGSMVVPPVIGVAVAGIGAWSLTPMLVVTALAVTGLAFIEH